MLPDLLVNVCVPSSVATVESTAIVPLDVIGPPVNPVPVATLVTVPNPVPPVTCAGLMFRVTKSGSSITVTSKFSSSVGNVVYTVIMVLLLVLGKRYLV